MYPRIRNINTKHNTHVHDPEKNTQYRR